MDRPTDPGEQAVDGEQAADSKSAVDGEPAVEGESGRGSTEEAAESPAGAATGSTVDVSTPGSGESAGPGADGGTETTSRVEVRSALFAEDLAVGYPTTEEPVVDTRRIDVPEGEITTLVGPNGSGKSTLLKAISDHLPRERGTVVLDGQAVEDYGSKELARALGHLHQEHTAPDGITVEELVHHGRYPHRGFFESITPADRAAVERAIELAGVEALREQAVGQLSGGQKQLVWIAMVLAQDTDVLLLDEPTTFLDLNHQLRVLETIRRLNEDEGVTVAVVLHDIAQATRFADYLIALEDGAVYDWGPPRDVVTEELLADVFEVAAAVERGPQGEPRIFPQHPLSEGENDDAEDG